MTAINRQSVSLPDLLAGLASAPDVVVSDLSLDSRTSTDGSLFFAYPGESVDGRDYIPEAVSRGAVAVVYEPADYEPGDCGVPQIPVEGARDKVSIIADRFFGSPSHRVHVIGITGTNGKTTCCYLLAQALGIAGNSTGIIGTLGVGRFPYLDQGPNTTPGPVSMQRELASMVEQGVDKVCVEVSSHALDQGRVSGVSFHATMFTNLSQDHLDYHGDMQSYAAAKARLFTGNDGPIAVINIDDVIGRDLLNRSQRAQTWSFGKGGDLCARAVDLTIDGISLLIGESHKDRQGNVADDVVETYRVSSRLIGRINVPNLVAVITMLRAEGIGKEAIPGIIEQLEPAPGRMELMRAGAGKPWVVVDYAHTPEALQLALASLREYCRGVLWCVFGCGGDRDREKRPLMGAVVEKMADRAIVTDDNPRSEVPRRIADDILAGMQQPAEVIQDRATAIQWVISQADSDDWVLVAGKGHETEQIVGDQHLDFDDRHWVRECLGVAA